MKHSGYVGPTLYALGQMTTVFPSFSFPHFLFVKRHGMCKRGSYADPSEKSDFCQVFPKSFCLVSFVCLFGVLGGVFLAFIGF